jgi:hypothetical protein
MVINKMKTRVIKVRSPHLLSSLLVAIACTHLLKPVKSFAQTTMPSKLTLRNGSQPSDSLIKVLLDWKELEGQRVTISDVNLFCLNNICMLVAGGQGIRIQSSQLKRDLISKKTPQNAGAALGMVGSSPQLSGAADAMSSD